MKFIKAEQIDNSKYTVSFKPEEIDGRNIDEGKYILVKVETITDEIALEEFMEQQKNK